MALLRFNCTFNARAGTKNAKLPLVKVKLKLPSALDWTQLLVLVVRSDIKSHARLLAGKGFDEDGRIAWELATVFVTATRVGPRVKA